MSLWTQDIICSRRMAAPIGIRSSVRVDEGVAPPHPSQTRMCRFPASGSSWESLAHGGVAVNDPGRRQRVTLEECGESAPMEPVSVPPPRQPFLPCPRDLTGIPAQSSAVTRYAVVGIVAPHHRGQMGVLVGDRQMPVDPTARASVLSRSAKAIAI